LKTNSRKAVFQIEKQKSQKVQRQTYFITPEGDGIFYRRCYFIKVKKPAFLGQKQ
jgi:hypothetical protein